VSFYVGKLHGLREENRPRVFEKRVFRRLFGTESQEKTPQLGVPYFILHQIVISSAMRW
jgi:hypothetical protein